MPRVKHSLKDTEPVCFGSLSRILKLPDDLRIGIQVLARLVNSGQTFSHQVSIQACQGVLLDIGVGGVDEPKVQQITLALVDVCNELETFGKVFEPPVSFGPILA